MHRCSDGFQRGQVTWKSKNHFYKPHTPLFPPGFAAVYQNTDDWVGLVVFGAPLVLLTAALHLGAAIHYVPEVLSFPFSFSWSWSATWSQHLSIHEGAQRRHSHPGIRKASASVLFRPGNCVAAAACDAICCARRTSR